MFTFFSGILLQEQQRYDEALASYKAAIRFRPRLASAYLNMGYVYNLMNRHEKAIEMYELCASIDGEGLKDPRTHERSRMSALFNLGKLYADQGEHRQALAVYRRATSKENSQSYYQIHSLYNLIAESHTHLGEYEQAEECYLKGLQLKPDHLPLHLTYAKFLQKVKRLDEAERWYLAARSLAPSDPSVLLHFGKCPLHGQTEVDQQVQPLRKPFFCDQQSKFHLARPAGQHAQKISEKKKS